MRREHGADCPVPGRTFDTLLQGARGEVSITLTGGEPLLAFHRVREIVSAVETARPRDATIRWTMFTNGLLLDAANLAFLATHDSALRVSFDGIASAQVLRGHGTFGRLDALLGRLKAEHHRLFRNRLSISVVLSPVTVRDLEASVDYFLRKRVADVAIGPAMGAPSWRTEQIDELDAAFARVSTLSLRHYETTSEVPLSIFRKTRADSASDSAGWICAAPDPESLALDIDGVAYGCVLATGTYQQSGATPAPAAVALRVGRPGDPQFDENLAQMPDRARASGAFDHAERRYSSYRRCADCEYLGRCRICPLATAHGPAPADPDRVPDFLCAFNMVTLKYRDRFPCQVDGFDLLTGAVPFPRLDV